MNYSIKNSRPSLIAKPAPILTMHLFTLLLICLFAQSSNARTNAYVFDPNQSTIVQTGGIAGIHRTYIVEGQFQLAVDYDTDTAAFEKVDANAVDDSPYKNSLDPNEVFAMTSIVGVVLSNTTLKFTGYAADGSSILLEMTIAEDIVTLKTQTTPPPNSADFFIFSIDAVAHRKYAGGTGEPNNPFLIYTAEQLNTIGTEPNDLDKHFRLMANIDLSAYTGTEFNIIGDDKPFTGVFEGNGYSISNINISDNINYGGIVSRADGAEIRDLVLIDPNVCLQPGGRYAGSLAGYLSNSKIDNCNVLGGHVIGNQSVGGLVGRIYNSEIIDSSFEGSVSGNNEVGGIVGAVQSDFLMDSGVIIKCNFNGQVSGGSDVGGLVGILVGRNYISISDCNVTADVSGVNKVGGLIGYQTMGITTNCVAAGSVLGTSEVGGFAGNCKGYMENCYTTANVSGVQDVSGFAGQNGVNYTDVVSPGNIYNSYSRGNVVGEENVGGFVGYNYSYGTIYNCYATGSVSGTIEVGGLVGKNYPGDCINSFWDIETSGQTISTGGTGKTTAQMQDPYTYLNAGWDFVGEIQNGTHEVWQMTEKGGYPVLAILNGYTPPQLQGKGTSEEPYLISDAMELGAMINYSPSAHYRLTASIDLSDINWSVAVIAPDSKRIKFVGEFDGDGHKISHLTISGLGYLGLFGQLGDGAVIRNLGVMDVNIMGSAEFVGGLVGYNRYSGTVIQCYSTGIICGTDRHIGGLVGENRGDMIQCYSTSTVSGASYVGGLVGNNYKGTLVHCYSTGLVNNKNPGRYVGGLVGEYGDSVAQCFWDTQTSGQTRSAGGTGKTTAEMQTESTFTDAGWDFTGETTNGDEDIWWMLENDYPRLWWELTEEDVNTPNEN